MKAVLFVFLLLSLSAHAEDWVVNGKTYKNVVVGKVEPDKVHITYDGGLGAVPLDELPPELQKRFNYDPAKAQAAAADEQAHLASSDAARAATVTKTTPASELVTAPAQKSGDATPQLLDLYATVDLVSKSGYRMTVLSSKDYFPGINDLKTVGEMRKSFPNMHPLAMPNGGSCYLVTPEILAVNQFVRITVYAAGVENSDDGFGYRRFTVDPAEAAKLILQDKMAPKN